MGDPGLGEHRVRFGGFELDPRQRELRREGRRVRISGKPFDLLVALAERPGVLVTRDELRKLLWGDDTYVAFDDGLNAAVRKVREALEDDADAPTFIETIPKHGYRLIAPLDAAPQPLPAPPVSKPHSRRALIGTVVLGLAVVAALALLTNGAMNRPRDSSASLVRFQVRAPDGTYFPSGDPRLAVSPDGRAIAFLAYSSEGRHVWVQSLGDTFARRLPTSRHAWNPFWSPDSTELAFYAEGQLRIARIVDGTTRTLTLAAHASGGAWSPESGILVPALKNDGLIRVDPVSGAVDRVTSLDRSKGEVHHMWPQFLRDGRRFIFTAIADPREQSAVYLGRVGEAAPRSLFKASSKAAYVEPGILLFMRGRDLLAQRTDPGDGAVVGSAILIGTGLMPPPTMTAAFSVSPSGVLAYSQPSRYARRQLTWVNRAGQPLGTVAEADYIQHFALSPDEHTVMIERPDPDTRAPDIWRIDIDRGTKSRITASPGNDEQPVWAPTGSRFIYGRHRALLQPSDLYVFDLREQKLEQPLLDDHPGAHPMDWSGDGRLVLYDIEGPAAQQDIWVVPVDRPGARFAWRTGPADERNARFSPDGQWIAFESNLTGRTDVYLAPFHSPQSARLVSANGGSRPAWRGDGRELFYVDGDDRLVAIDVGASGHVAGSGRVLFEIRRLQTGPSDGLFEPTADGQRFLIARLVDPGGDEPITVVLNWQRVLEEK